MVAMIMQHALMTMAPTVVFAKMDSQEMDSIVQVTILNFIYPFTESREDANRLCLKKAFKHRKKKIQNDLCKFSWEIDPKIPLQSFMIEMSLVLKFTVAIRWKLMHIYSKSMKKKQKFVPDFTYFSLRIGLRNLSV